MDALLQINDVTKRYNGSGQPAEEIAGKLGCTTRTVERKLHIIRRLWNFGNALQ